jgi:hypothetical protein
MVITPMTAKKRIGLAVLLAALVLVAYGLALASSHPVILRRVGIVIYMLALLGLGTLCLAKPRRVQEIGLRLMKPRGPSERLFGWYGRWSVRFVESDAFIPHIRRCGVGLYLMVAALLLALFLAAQQGPPGP